MGRIEFADGTVAYYREGTSDFNTLKEVLETKCYGRIGVMPGEHWLDLGANVGAFALYAASQGARTTCYEPDAECFKMLTKNVSELSTCVGHNSAVTASKEKLIKFYKSPREASESRNTVFHRHGYKEYSTVYNKFVGTLGKFDGIKMDIEGSEGPILDAGLLPKCNKFVMEYHSSVDDSLSNFFRRIKYLKTLFKRVEYSKEFDRAKEQKLERYKPFFDRNVFAWKE